MFATFTRLRVMCVCVCVCVCELHTEEWKRRLHNEIFRSNTELVTYWSNPTRFRSLQTAAIYCAFDSQSRSEPVWPSEPV